MAFFTFHFGFHFGETLCKSSNPQILKSSNPQILKNSVKNLVKLSSAFLLLSQSVYAVEIIGNITGTYDSGGMVPLSDVNHKAVSFQMGAQAHTLDNVKIALSSGVGTEASAQTFVELRSHDGTSTPTSTVIATLNPNPLTATAYGATPTAPTVTTFTPAIPITLQASTKYWIVARGGSSANFLYGRINGSGSAPANGAGTYLSYNRTIDGGISWSNAGWNLAVQINGTVVVGGTVSAPIFSLNHKPVETFATEIELK